MNLHRRLAADDLTPCFNNRSAGNPLQHHPLYSSYSARYV